MLTVCTSCNSKYLVNSADLKPNGRDVKCAICGHEWFQKPNLPQEEVLEPSIARVFKKGVLFNDTKSDCLRSVKRDGTEVNLKIPTYPEKELTHTDMDDSRIARQGFARGLCVVDKNLVAVGSSPSTISIFDLEKKKRVGTVNLSMDIRNAIHGLEVWPYERLLDS